MHDKYPRVFSPIQLGSVDIKNRFYFSPHGVGLVVGSEPSNDFAYYSAERVRGGCGLVINSLPVHGIGISPYAEANVPSFQAMAEAIHREDGKIFGELWYYWANPGQWGPLTPPRVSIGPSYYQLSGTHVSSHAMTRDEIRSLVDAYRQSALHLRQAGYDGIEIHVSHAAIAEQFLSPYFNHRDDEYGGSRANRMRFMYECLNAVRESAGDEMAVGIRFNCDELLPGGNDQTETTEILREVCESGLVDFVDLDIAVEPNQMYLGMPSVFIDPRPYEPYVAAMRGAVGSVPVLSVLGRITSIGDAETAISAGVCDMVGAARGLIAEPFLVRNAEEGHEERSRTCIACNWCMEAGLWGAAGCSINPASHRERLWGVETLETPATEVRQVVVVGGGPGGLEAARVAAEKGHRVTLFERTGRLGGGLRGWATLPGREFYQVAVDWWTNDLERLGVDVRLGHDAIPELVLDQAPDAVVVATGAHYSRSGRSGFLDRDIPGFEQDFVHIPEDVLAGGVEMSGKVVVLDAEGLHPGVGLAERLARAGAEVTLLTPNLSPVAPSLVASLEVRFVMQRLQAAGVTIRTHTYIRSIGDRTVEIYDVFSDAAELIADVDGVLLVTARYPHDPLSDALKGKVAQVFTIGDALSARPMAAATYDGQKFARFIGEPGAPASFDEAYWQPVPVEDYPRPASVLLPVS